MCITVNKNHPTGFLSSRQKKPFSQNSLLHAMFQLSN